MTANRDGQRLSRRKAIKLASGIGIGISLAGCSGDGDSDSNGGGNGGGGNGGSGGNGDGGNGGDGDNGGSEPADVSDEVIITGPLDGWANYGEQRDSFMEKHPNIEWPEGTKNSGQSLNALRNGENNPVNDVAHHGITDGITAANEDLLTSYEPENIDEVPDNMVHEEYKWTGIYYGTIAMAVNKNIIDSVPSGFEDLLDDTYRDAVSFYDPSSAFNGFVAFTNMNLSMGGSLDDYDPAIEFLNQLNERGNVAGVPKQGLQTSFLQGQYPIYIAYDFNMYEAKYQSDLDPEQVEIVIPEETSVQVPYVVGLVDDAPHPEAAKLLMDHHLSDEGQRIFAEAFVNPVRPIEYPEEIAEQRLPESAYESSEPIDYEKLVGVQDDARERYVNEVA